MAYGNWNDIVKEYQGIYSKSPRTSEHAHGMLRLIPELRNMPGIEQLVPGTSHATLFLKSPSKLTEICVWFENELYIIYLYDSSLDVSEYEHYDDEKVKVTFNEVISVLLDFIDRVRKDEKYS